MAVDSLDFDELELKELEKRDKREEKELKKKKYIESEYEDAFSGDEQLEHRLFRIKSKIDIRLETINVEDIITSNFKKISREDSVVGLAGVVGEWGVVSPIHVLALEMENTYLLLDGLRRVFASLRNGQEMIPAMVWDFEDKEEGKEMANILSLMVNRSQNYTAKEMWEQMKILEEVNGLGPGLIEFLLQMDSGDAMKLKDVMLADMDYAEIQEKLLSGEYTIDAAYRKLCNMRKKENKLAKEDKMSIEETNEVDDNQRLGIDEVKDLLELTETDIEDLTLEDMDKTSEIRGEHVQSTDARHPVDPAIKQATLMRDGFKCRCCGIGGHEGWLGVLVYHHVIPVFLGGPDSEDNGLTLCVNCHLTLHTYANGKLTVRINTLSEEEQKVFKNIFRYGNIIIEGMKRAGIKREEAKEKMSGSLRHPFPGEGLSENTTAFKASTIAKETK